MADYNQLPIKIEADNEEYVVQLGDNGEYGEEELLSPNESGDFSEYQDYHDAGGKLRLKRRRKCGQCGPCQVKENCDKCHYCLRRDVLKQSCIYRKCLYLRKKVPRIRSDSLNSNNVVNRPTGPVPTGVHLASPPVVCVSPNQGPIHSPTEINSCRLPSPPFVSPSSVGPSPPGPSPQSLGSDPSRQQQGQQQHLDPLRGFQPEVRHMSPETMRPFSQEAMRSHSAERPRSLQGDMRPMSAEAALSPPASQGSMVQAQPDLLRHLPTDPYQAHMNHLQQIQNSQLPQLPKDQIGPRTINQLRHFSPEHYGSVPYGHPRHMIPPHGLPNPYGFSTSNIPPVSSSQMSLPQACRYTVPTQPAFHPHLTYNSSLRPPSFNSPPHSASIMTPPFYPPPPHAVPTSLASLPLGQYPAHPPQATYSAGGFGSPHPAMYPGSLYRPFRPPNEHFIYHARLPSPTSVFSEQTSCMSQFRDQYLKKAEEEEDHKKFDIFRLTKKTDTELMREQYLEESDPSAVTSVVVPEKDKVTSIAPLPKPHVDGDLLEQINSVSRDKCNVTITIDDLKMQAFIRSDGVNNLEIEIESPTSTMSPDSATKSPTKECSPSSHSNPDAQSSSRSDSNKNNSEQKSTDEEKQAGKSKPTLKRKLTVSGTVCLKQDLGDEGIMQLELPGHKVQIEDTVLDDYIVKQSDNPSELVKFISDPSSKATSFPETIIIN